MKKLSHNCVHNFRDPPHEHLVPSANSAHLAVELLAFPDYSRPTRLKAKLLLALCSGSVLFAQHAVDAANRYFRVIALVHLTGSGKNGESIRPEYAPDSSVLDRHGIIAWTYLPTDNDRMAIVQFVAADRAAFKAIFRRDGLVDDL